MSDWFKNYHFPQTTATSVLTPIAEEKGGEAPRLSFAQRVEALGGYHYQAIRWYLPKQFEGLPAGDQRMMLGRAIEGGHSAAVAVEAFIKCGVGVDQRDDRGLTPLLQSCGNVKVMKVLLKNGADPNLSGPKSFDFTPLLRCIALKDFGGARYLVNSGADVNLRRFSDMVAPLHLAAAVPHDADDRSHFIQFLLLRGANPVAKDLKGERPKLQLRHFQGLGPDLTTALKKGKRQQVDRWIRAVGNFLPDAKAASLLVEWAGLCNSDEKLSRKIHTLIKDYLEKLEGEPPADVADYVTKYNAWVEEQEVQDKQEKIMKELASHGLVSKGTGKEFRIEGENYSLQKHGPLLMQLANFWADQKGNHMDHVVGILTFAAKSAREQQAPQDVRDKLYADVKALRNRLKKSSDPEIAGRVKALDSFLNPFN